MHMYLIFGKIKPKLVFQNVYIVAIYILPSIITHFNIQFFAFAWIYTVINYNATHLVLHTTNADYNIENFVVEFFFCLMGCGGIKRQKCIVFFK